MKAIFKFNFRKVLTAKNRQLHECYDVNAVLLFYRTSLPSNCIRSCHVAPSICCFINFKNKKGHIQCPLIDSFIHYFPIQNDPKILPNKSSALNSPVISTKAFCARRKDSATNSPA